MRYATETPAAKAVTSGFQRVWESLVDNLDTDGDGRVSRDEISSATRQYFTSTDPEAPGNNLYGPLA